MTGNQGGFDLFEEFKTMNKSIEAQNGMVDALNSMIDAQDERIDAQNEKINAQNEKIESQRQELKILYDAEIRNGMNELMKRSKHSSLDVVARQVRNQETHGADIRFHQYLLRLPGYDQGKLDACAEGFEATYGFSPAVYDSHFGEAPQDIIRIANKRGDLYYLYAYTKSTHHKEEIGKMKKICGEILALWISQNGTTISEDIRAKISELDDLHNLWEEEEAKTELQEEKD